MKRHTFIALFLSFISLTGWSQRPVDYVNPFIGTTNYGATNPGAIAPQGMVSVVPFNVTGSSLNKFDKDTQWWSTPYSHENKFFTGFSHVNLSGVGCPELGVILAMPTTGTINADPKQYGSVHSGEVAHPGYYKTVLEKYGIIAEATATQRSGLSRFYFPQGKSNILIDLGVGLTNESGAMLRIINSQEVEGYRMTGTFCYSTGSERPVYFVARFSKPAIDFGAWKKMPQMKAEKDWSNTSGQFKYYKGFKQEMTGDSIGAWFTFDTKTNEPVMVRVGISYVSIQNARLNLQTEQKDYDFEAIQKTTEAAWNNKLSKVLVEGGTPDQRTVFYTALYHMLIHPNVLNDVNGQYPAMETYETKQVENGDRYTVFSLWDTYRNLHPFMSLVYPEAQLNMVRSLVDMYKESGWLPKWELNSRETYVMEGDPAIPVIVDTYKRGLKDFDVQSAYDAMIKSTTLPGKENRLRPDNDDYLKFGYIPLREQFDKSVSHALEYYVADWNLSQFAKALGKEKDAERYLAQSLRYKGYFDKEFNMIRPRMADGKFLTPFNPRQGENFQPCPGFHEGSAWQYAFYVPHDIPGLMMLMGGAKPFVSTLQKVFDENLFDMANEPDINYPYLFTAVKGQEWRTQKTVRALIDKYYKNAPDGIPGNDDCGTLSAWVVYSMMGFYPVCPGNTDYTLTAPVFDRITITLDKNYYPTDKLVIVADKMGKKNDLIYKMVVEGKPYRKYVISHKDLVKAGTIQFFLKDNDRK
ncbi:MAG: GH92 family glycosyl hydrolase [Bacteroidota bacterium]|nr:GH92 family glycosyl hydrolase [Bacteroidota bacterium]